LLDLLLSRQLHHFLFLTKENIMAFLGETISVNDLPQREEAGNYDPLPAGWYTANISGAELKATKAGDGQYIAVRYDITGPTHQGRVVFGNINVRNASAKAEEIGRQQLGEIMRAIGLAKVSDTDELIGGGLSIKLDIKEATADYKARNEVRGFKALEGSPTTFKAAAPASAPASGPAKAAPPWAKK
jgi:hypothetical protein